MSYTQTIIDSVCKENWKPKFNEFMQLFIVHKGTDKQRIFMEISVPHSYTVKYDDSTRILDLSGRDNFALWKSAISQIAPSWQKLKHYIVANRIDTTNNSYTFRVCNIPIAAEFGDVETVSLRYLHYLVSTVVDEFNLNYPMSNIYTVFGDGMRMKIRLRGGDMTLMLLKNVFCCRELRKRENTKDIELQCITQALQKEFSMYCTHLSGVRMHDYVSGQRVPSNRVLMSFGNCRLQFDELKQRLYQKKIHLVLDICTPFTVHKFISLEQEEFDVKMQSIVVANDVIVSEQVDEECEEKKECLEVVDEEKSQIIVKKKDFKVTKRQSPSNHQENVEKSVCYKYGGTAPPSPSSVDSNETTTTSQILDKLSPISNLDDIEPYPLRALSCDVRQVCCNDDQWNHNGDYGNARTPCTPSSDSSH